MKTNKNIILSTIALVAMALTAQAAAPAPTFDGLMFTDRDPLQAAKRAVTSFIIPDRDPATRWDYNFAIRSNASCVALAFAQRFCAISPPGREEAVLEHYLYEEPAVAASTFALLDSFVGQFYSTIDRTALNVVFDTIETTLNANRLGYTDRIPAALKLVAKFDVIQRVLRVLFMRLPGMAIKYETSFPTCLTIGPRTNMFIKHATAERLDPLSQLYNHILSEVDKDTNLVPADKKADVKKYIADSAKALKYDFLNTAACHPASRTTLSLGKRVVRAAIPIASALATGYYCLAHLSSPDTRTEAGDILVAGLLSATAHYIGNKIKNVVS